MLRVHIVALASLLWTVSVPAQTLPTIVLTEVAGNPASQLLAVDAATGVWQLHPRFASDNLPPLALLQDRIDSALYVALDAGAGSSRVVRLLRSGGTYVENQYATLPGRVVDLAIVNDELFIAVDAANGGVYRVPRRGGVAALALPLSNLTAMSSSGTERLALAWTGRVGTAVVDSGAGVLHTTLLAWSLGPFNFANPSGRETVGVIDLPVPGTQLLAFDDGSYVRFEPLTTTPMQPLVISPPFPFGAATAMHSRGPVAFNPVILGNASNPSLAAVNPWAGASTSLSLALPGAPIDFAYGQSAMAHTVEYGIACGEESLLQVASAPAQIGGQLVVAVDMQMFMLVLFAAGLDDFALGQLPAALPGGCLLQIVPDFVSLELASGSGTATKIINVPTIPSLLGSVVHTQWAHFDPTGFSVSSALANWIGF